MLFAIVGRFKPDAEATRQEIHERFNEHLMQRVDRVRFGGPLFDAAGVRTGVMLVVEAHDYAAAEAFLAASPYAAASLYERTEIAEIRPEVGYPR